MQGGLIGYLARDECLAAVAAEVEPLKPGSPAPVKDAFDANLVKRVRRHAAHARRPAGGQFLEADATVMRGGPGLMAAIYAVLRSSFCVICTLRRPGAPGVTRRCSRWWNLLQRQRAQKCGFALWLRPGMGCPAGYGGSGFQLPREVHWWR